MTPIMFGGTVDKQLIQIYCQTNVFQPAAGEVIGLSQSKMISWKVIPKFQGSFTFFNKQQPK